MGGGDKALIPFGGGTLLDSVLDRLAPQVACVALNVNGDPARFAALDLPFRADSIPGHPGPLAGILVGMDWAFEMGAEQVVTAAADTPFLPRDLVQRLQRASIQQGNRIAIAVTRSGQHPVFGIWPVSLRDTLRTAICDGVRRVTDFADCHGAAAAAFPGANPDPFFNVNRPEDLAVAEAIRQTSYPGRPR